MNTTKEYSVPQVDSRKFIFVMVGLPARGKSSISSLLSRYFNWLGVKTKVFNIGSYRRKELGSGQKHNFFDPENTEGFQSRRKMALLALEDMVNYLVKDEGQVGIFDGTNSTRERRKFILDELAKKELPDHRIVFIESICQDDKIVEQNINSVKVKSQDYAGVDDSEAYNDFKKRIEQYVKYYEPLDEKHDEDKSYLQVIDAGRRVILNHIRGYIPSKMTSLVMNNNILPRKIFFSRHGESEYNTFDKLGGDSGLSSLGKNYSYVLADFVKNLSNAQDLCVFTSTLRRTIETSEKIELKSKNQFKHWRALDEIDAGICDGMTYKQIEEEMPNEFLARKKDKFNYRYPRGESYKDMIYRLEPIIMEIERRRGNLLVISHQAVTRVLYAYFMGRRPEECCDISIPLHTVIEITPGFFTRNKEIRYDLNEKVKNCKMNKL